jgi:hypothetical protein
MIERCSWTRTSGKDLPMDEVMRDRDARNDDLQRGWGFALIIDQYIYLSLPTSMTPMFI